MRVPRSHHGGVRGRHGQLGIDRGPPGASISPACTSVPRSKRSLRSAPSLLASVADKGTIDVLVIRSVDGELYRAMVTDVVGSAGASRPRVVFTRSEERVYLSEVWESGKPSGCRIKSGQDQLQTAATPSDKVTLIAAADWR